MAARKKAAGKPRKKAATKKPAATRNSRSAETNSKARLWLTYPAKLITKPTVWELSQKFPVVTNVRQASVTGEIGLVCLELEGPGGEIKKAITWLKRRGISVEPVEINVIAG